MTDVSKALYYFNLGQTTSARMITLLYVVMTPEINGQVLMFKDKGDQ